jgi:23S rRNA (pseudouridine1915-N3)-methyltransferase
VNLHLVLPDCKKDSLSYKSEETFLKRINSYLKVQVHSFKPEKNGNADYKKEKDYQRIIKLIPKDSKLVICDESGEGLSTKKLLIRVDQLSQISASITFVIGGPYGLAEKLKDSADLKLKLSDLTMNSDLACAVLWEQLYRIFSLKNGHPYHND